jgi:hypothetical protein
VVLLENTHTSDVEDVVKTHSMYVITLVPVVDSLMRKEENTLGSNGIHKCKKLNIALKMRLIH